MNQTLTTLISRIAIKYKLNYIVLPWLIAYNSDKFALLSLLATKTLIKIDRAKISGSIWYK